MAHRPKPRQRKPPRAEIEADLLEQPRWAGLRQQRRLQSRHHTAEENAEGRRACRALVAEGWGSDPEFVAWQQRQAPVEQTELDLNRI